MQRTTKTVARRQPRLLAILMALMLLGMVWGQARTVLAEDLTEPVIPGAPDTSQEDYGDDNEIEAQHAGQGFQTTKGGKITHIALWVYSGAANNNVTINVEVREGVPGAGGASKGTATRTFTNMSMAGAWVNFVFATPITVTGNTPYHYIVTYTGSSGIIRLGYKIHPPEIGGSPYPDGDSWTWIPASGTWQQPPWTDADFAFIVYLALNQAPTLATNDGLTADEGATTAITNTDLNITDPDGDTITYTVGTAPGNGALKKGAATVGTFTQAEIAAGQIAYVHNGSETTSDSFTFTASDGKGGNIPSNTFNITVNPVNDAPTFNLGADVTRLEDSGAYSQANFLTGASAGEAGQTIISTTVSNSNNGLFSAQPAIDGSGQLTFTPNTNANGTATVTVTVQDNGGTANSGDDSTDKTFTITITAVNDPPSFTPGADQTVDEDSGLKTVAPWATVISAGPGEPTQTVSFTVTTNNDSLFTLAGKPAVAANGTLTFTPALNAFGTATVTVRAVDTGDTANGGSNQSAPHELTITVNPINDAPVFTLGSDVTVGEDSVAYSGANFLTGLSAVEAGQTITSTTVSNNNNTIFTVQPAIDGTGKLTFTPAPDASGTATVTVTVKDDGGTSNGGADTTTKTFQIDITPVNDAPKFNLGGNVTVLEESAAYGADNFLTDASAVEAGQTLTQTVSYTNGGYFSTPPAIDGAGRLTFTPAANAHGTSDVTVTLKDNGGTAGGGVDTATKTFTITITGINDAPSFTAGANQAVNEDAGTQTVATWATAINPGPNEGTQTVSFTVTTDNDSLFTVAGKPAVANDGTLTYTPAPDAFGSALVTVTANDGGGTDNGGSNTVSHDFTITVNPVNDAPVFNLGADVTVLEDAPAYSAANFLTGLSAVEGDQSISTLTVSNNNNGLFTVGGQPAIDGAGQLTFTPAADKNGTAVVTVTAKDDGAPLPGVDETTKTFSITITAVNDAPSFTKGPDQAVDEDAPTQTAANWATDIETGPNEPTQTVSFTVTSNNDSLFTLAGKPAVAANGTLTFTPAPDAFGTAEVTVTANDGGDTLNGGSNTASNAFTITVNPINDAPVFTLGSNVTVLEDAAAYSGANFLTGLSAVEAGQTTTLTISNDNNGLFTAGGQPAIGGTGTLTFTVAPDAFGTAQVTVKVKDNGGTDNGGVDETTKTFSITLTPVNDAPVFTLGDNVTVLEDSAAYEAESFLTGASAVEAGQTLTQTISHTNGSLFTFAPAIDGDGKLTFTPAPDAHGTSNVTVTLTDNGDLTNGGDNSTAKTFSIIITAVNDAPSFTAGANQTVNEDAGTQTVANWATAIDPGTNEPTQTVSFTVTTNNDSLFTVAGKPAVSATGTLTYTPAPDAFGSATVTVTANDGGDTDNGGSNSVSHDFTVTIKPVNDAPVFTLGSNVTVLEDADPHSADNFLTGRSAVEAGQNTTLTISNDNNALFTVAGQPAIDGDGKLTFTPAPDAFGTALVTVKVTDDGGTAIGGDDETIKTFTITITPVNDAPVFTLGSDVTVLEDSAAYSAANFLTGASAVEVGQTLSQTVTNDNNSLFTIAGQPALTGGTLTFTPAPDAHGTAVVTVTLTDNGDLTNGGDNETAKTFSITITPINDAPAFTIGADQTVDEDAVAQTVPNWATGISAGNNEPDQTLTVTVTNDKNDLFSVQPAVDNAGTLTFTPALNAFGTAQVTMKVQDSGDTSNGGSNISSQTFTITVNSVNDAPVAEAQNLSVIVDDELTGKAAAFDVEKDPLTYSLVVAPKLGKVTIQADGSFRYVSGTTGTDMFTFKASDGMADSNVATVTVAVNGRPVLPILTISVPVTETRESSIVVSGTANFGATVTVAGRFVQADAQGRWSTTVTLVEGPNGIVATNGSLSRSVTVTRDTTPPVLTLTASATRTEEAAVVLTATANEEGARIQIEGEVTASLTVPLKMGQNRFSATATDRLGNSSSATISVLRVGNLPPVREPVEPGKPGGAKMLNFRVDLPGDTVTEPLLLQILSPSADAAAIRLAEGAAEVAGTGDGELTNPEDGAQVTDVTATVTFEYDPQAVSNPAALRIFYFDTKHSRWVEIGGEVNSQTNTITVQVGHFTSFAALVPQAAAPVLPELPAEVESEQLTVSGTAPAGMTVSLVINGDSQVTVTTGQDGRYTMEGTLAEGRNWVYVMGPGALASREWSVTYRPEVIYTDIGGHWAEATINRLAKLRIVTVYAPPIFGPEAKVTRLEFAVMVARVLGLTPLNEAPAFTDTESMPEWARPEMAAAYKAGIIKGMPDGSFAPARFVSRAEMAIMLTRALGYAGKDITPGENRFADDASIPDWAKDQVYTAARYGLISGYPDGSFQPVNDATRAEAAAMLSRLLDQVSK